MGLFKTAVYAAAAYGVYRLLTDRDQLTGLNVLDKIEGKAEEITEEVAILKEKVLDEVATVKSIVS